MISLDTETTGLDLHHGAKPFLVTICDEVGVNCWWEWPVDPLTRQPKIDSKDLEQIRELFKRSDQVVLQNSKFDFMALSTVFKSMAWWDWNKVDDTLFAGHLLASNQPHDLTTMAIVYLHTNIQPYEDRMKQACMEARRLVSKQYPDWRLAKPGLSEMPSAKASTWKYDSWLPRLVAEREKYGEDHPWRTVTSEYANSDSATTIELWKVQRGLIEKRGLTCIYQERLKLLPVVSAMEQRGVTISRRRLNALQEVYQSESSKSGRVCLNIAKSLGHELVLPKSGNNKSLTTFVFNGLKLPSYKKSKKTGAPSLDKSALENYLATLPKNGRALAFIQALLDKRGYDTGLSYMEGYQRFWRPINADTIDKDNADWFALYPSLNPTGTDTLRFSSSNPNEQNISKKENFNLRYCFGPAPGREWWSMDAKNIELRLPAYESGEKELIDLFEHPDDPPYYGSTHLLNFHTIYPDIWEKELREVGLEKVGSHCKEKYTSTWYKWCKNGGFAIQYGAMDRADGSGTADRAFHRPGSHAKLKARFGKLEALNNKWITFARRHGYVETIPDKTVDPARGYPLLCTRNKWGADVAPTIPLNYHVQSTAMWWMMKAMIRCHAQLQEWRKIGFDACLVMQIHDELVFDFPKGNGKEPWHTNLPKIRRLKRLMEQGGDDLGILTPVSCEYHPVTWSEGMGVL